MVIVGGDVVLDCPLKGDRCRSEYSGMLWDGIMLQRHRIHMLGSSTDASPFAPRSAQTHRMRHALSLSQLTIFQHGTASGNRSLNCFCFPMFANSIIHRAHTPVFRI